LKRLKLPSQIGRLLESKDKEGKDWEVVIIQAGASLNNKVYPASVLKKAVDRGLFEDVKSYAFEFNPEEYKHQTDEMKKVAPFGFIKNMVGWFDHTRYGEYKDESGQTQEGVLGRFHIDTGASWLRKRLKDAWDHAKKSILGFSIDGNGVLKEIIKFGKKLLRVDEIAGINSVDIVTHPAAGGHLRRLLASLDEEVIDMKEWLKKLYEYAKKFHESLIEGIDPENITEEQEYSLIKSLIENEDFLNKEKDEIKEANPFASDMIDRLIELVEKGEKADAIKLLKQLKTKVKGYTYPAKAAQVSPPVETPPVQTPPPADTSEATKKMIEDFKKQQDELNAILETAKVNASKVLLEKKLGESKLPEVIQRKLRKQFDGQPVEESKIIESIKEEVDIVSALRGSGQVNGLGDTGIDIGLDEIDKRLAAVDKMLGNDTDEKFKDVGSFTSIKECYRAFHPEDPTVSGKINSKGHLQRLTENITTGDFTYALTVSMTKRAAKEFKIIDFPFEPVVHEVGIDNFKQQEIIKWGGFSTLPTVAERGTYGDLYEPHDERAVYTPGKKGGIVYITREVIKNDDLRYVQNLGPKIGRAGRRTRNRDVSALITANGTYGPTGSTVFSTLFDNYSTDAFGYDSLRDAKTRIRRKRERGTAEVTGTADGNYSTTTLGDSGETWTTNAYAGRYVRFVYGTGAGQRSLIASNTSTVLTFAAVTTQPDATTLYEISTASNDDEIMGLKAEYIIHGLDLEAPVNQMIINSPDRPDIAERAGNEHYKTLKPIISPYYDGTSRYYWTLAIGKAQGETIEIGYIDDQRDPALLLQDQPGIGRVFTNDEITWKVRFEYGLAIVENKGFDHNASMVL